MKWILWIIASILILFIGLIGVGYFLPTSQTVERNIEIEAYAEDVYALINDLRSHSQWEVLSANNGQVDMAFGGPESGVGQTAAWQTEQTPPVTGTQEIVESQPSEFVRLLSNIDGVVTTRTYALSENGNSENVFVLLRSEYELNGFPYLQRVGAKLSNGGLQKRLDRTLARLKTVVENQIKDSPDTQ